MPLRLGSGTISAGLAANAALKALTESAAEILGVSSQIGTVAKGKSAHLVVTDGDFDGDKTKVRYVFADGIKFDYEPDKKEESKKDDKKETAKKDEKKDESRIASDYATELEADRVPKRTLPEPSANQGSAPVQRSNWPQNR